MKRLYYLLLMVPLLLLSGCTNMEDEIFDESSAQRVNNLVDAAFKSLTASNEGWYFEYYPEVEEANNRGGYWFWCKFNSDYTVEAATEFNITNYPLGSICKSEFDITKSRGAIITFDIFNEILHYWAIPSGSRPNGYAGDHEFTIIEVKDDYIKVRGIKTNKYMHFYKKSDGKTVADAMLEISTGANTITAAPEFTAVVTGTNSATATRSNRFFTLTFKYNSGSEEVTEAIKLPFIPNRDGSGIKLYEPVKVMGKEITGFIFDATNKTLTSNDGSVILTQKFPPINETFVSTISATTWAFRANTTDMCSTLLTAYTAAEASILAIEGENITYANLGKSRHSSHTYPGISFICQATSAYGAGYRMNFTAIASTTDEVGISYVTTMGDGSYSTYQSAFLNPFVMPVSNKSPYLMTTDDENNPSWIKFVSKADPTFFFTVYL